MTINHCLIHGTTLIAGVCPQCEFSTEPALMRLTEDLSKAEAKNRSLQSKIDQIKADGCNGDGGASADAQITELKAKLEKSHEHREKTLLIAEDQEKEIKLLKKRLAAMTTAATVDKCLGCAGGICSGCKDRDKLIAELQPETDKEPELTLDGETAAPKAPRGRPKKDK